MNRRLRPWVIAWALPGGWLGASVAEMEIEKQDNTRLVLARPRRDADLYSLRFKS